MKFIADFHIHSHYSIATSKKLTPEHLDYWAKIKGISVVGTGDFTHPKWINELKEKVEPSEIGLFQLKNDFIINDPITDNNILPVRFMLTAEISNIYKKNGKVRKVHNVIFAPDFNTVEKIQNELLRRKFNITSDGRPILGIDSKDLLDLVLNISPEIFFVPAHIWTPWFSVLGEKSGFDSIEECFEDLSQYINAVETGLSSDPPMNWACSKLDKYTLLSNSDAHSPEKLGRNANLFDSKLDYFSIIEAIKAKNTEHFLGTIDLFPQEGKYHYAGHRKCNVCLDPVSSLKKRGICPVCNKPITNGVMNRIIQLSDREKIDNITNRPPFYSIIPLKEIIAEINWKNSVPSVIEKEYRTLIKTFGNEFNILLHLPVEDIAEKGGQLLGEAIKRMRNRQVFIKEGYDGEYGIIKVFNENELKINAAQSTLFSYEIIEKTETPEPRKLLNFNLKEYQEISKGIDFQDLPVSEPLKVKEEPAIYGLNNEQIKAVKHYKNPALVIAGPGTGKTRVLTYRICHLVENFNIPPDNILAVTFTNKASAEIKERILKTSVKSLAGKITIGTFHSLGLRIISEYCSLLNRKADFIIIDENDKIQVLKKIGYTNNYKQIIECISKEKQSLSLINSIEDDYLRQAFINYDENLYKSNAFDFDDLIYQAYRLLKMNNNILEKVRQKYRFIIIDEFQDINYAQLELIKLLLGNENNLMAIGDPNQAIYGFRGANNEYINNFKTTFSNSHVYTLNTSYRCTNNILKASHNILPKNETIQLIGQKTGDKVIIQQNLTEKSEAEFIARKIEKMIGGLRHFSMDSQIADGNEDFNISGLSQFAVLGRTKSVLQPFEKAFNDHSIPYQLIGDEKLTERPEIKDLISVFKYIESKNPIYINPDLKTFVIKHTDVFQTLNIRGQVEFILNNIHPDFSKINETQYKLLVKFSENCANSGELIRNISLSNEADLFNSGEKVSLMTIHASKGLEFECVFIAGCEEGIIPYSLFPEYKSNIDEESRLLYVGMTRAKNYLYLCHSEKRFYSGREMQLNRSGFINRIDESIISYDQSIQYKRNKQGYQLSLFD